MNSLVEWCGFLATLENGPQHRPGAYLITRLGSGKNYVGISVDIYRRIQDHGGARGNGRLAKAIRRYGRAAFVVRPLYYSLGDGSELPQIEGALIAAHDGLDGYNIMVADPTRILRSEAFAAIIRANHARPEVKAKRAASRSSPEVLARMSAGQKAAWQSASRKAEMSARARTLWASPDYRAKRRERGDRPEARLARSLAATERSLRLGSGDRLNAALARPETKARWLAKQIGRKHTPEALLKMSKAQRGRKHTPETRTKISEAHKGYRHSDAAKAKMSAVAAARALQGAANPNAKLTAEMVEEIRISPDGNVALAMRYGVTRNQIWSIRKKRSWNTAQ